MGAREHVRPGNAPVTLTRHETERYPVASISVGALMPATKSDLRLEALQSAPPNSWVALSEDETKVVAIGSSYLEVVKKSESAGVSDPVILRTPAKWLPYAV